MKVGDALTAVALRYHEENVYDQEADSPIRTNSSPSGRSTPRPSDRWRSSVATSAAAKGHGALHKGQTLFVLVRGGDPRRLGLHLLRLVDDTLASVPEVTGLPRSPSPLAAPTKRLGTAAAVEPGLLVTTFELGDRVLLCTDGLWQGLSETRMQQVVSAPETLGLAVREASAASRDDTLGLILGDRLGRSFGWPAQPSAHLQRQLSRATREGLDGGRGQSDRGSVSHRLRRSMAERSLGVPFIGSEQR